MVWIMVGYISWRGREGTGGGTKIRVAGVARGGMSWGGALCELREDRGGISIEGGNRLCSPFTSYQVYVCIPSVLQVGKSRDVWIFSRFSPGLSTKDQVGANKNATRSFGEGLRRSVDAVRCTRKGIGTGIHLHFRTSATVKLLWMQVLNTSRLE